MSVDSATHGGIDPATLHTSSKVLIAYADTYFGSRLFHQLQNEKNVSKATQQYKLIACTWEKDSVQKILDGLMDKALGDVDGCSPLATNNDADGVKEDVEETTSPLKESQGKLSFQSPAAAAISTTNVSGEVWTCSSTRVFWRGDMTNLRRAILEADYIVMELRQAQDVFDMMHVLELKELQKPKRIIVISSLLTWYATPSLQLEPDDNNLNNSTNMEKGDYEEGEEEEHVERLKEPDLKQIEAILGHGAVEDVVNDNNSDEQDGDEEENVELFTEDQYNRRIPHAKYYNWREAERVVAAGNSEERRINTCVVFSGLQYGEGEDALKPFFAQVWNRRESGLPVYGDGTQFVPTVHVRDLVTFTLRLLRAETPPALPYVFATDCGVTTWKRMVDAINHVFGGEKTFDVPPERFVLYSNVELFTVNMRVHNLTMQDLMPEDEDWVARNGFVKCIEKVAFEYIEAHKLEPIRIVILGPPLSGKTFVATALASRHYNLPIFTMEQAIEDYKAHVAELKERLNNLRSFLFDSEKSRREEAKKQAFLRSRHIADMGTGEKETDDSVPKEAKGDDSQQQEANGGISSPNAATAEEKNQRWIASDEDGDVEEDTVDITLTEEEKNEVNAFVEEWYQENPVVAKLRETIASMERVLSMKVRVQHSFNTETPGLANLKKKRELGRLRRGGRSFNKKNTAEDEDAAAELQENAPFQDKALALIMRWRLSRADCRNQGYVLDGFPETVAQARLVFSDEPLEIPEVVEESHVVITNASVNNPSTGVAAAPFDMNVLPPTVEPCDESRLPSFVFILDAPNNFLLNRLGAISNASNEPSGNDEKRLTRFEDAMALYQRQFQGTEYSLANFFECARTVAGSLTPGGRSVTVKVVAADKEPLLPPPPPESSFDVVPPSQIELELCEQIGEPHNFGPTPLQKYEEAVRKSKLQLEEHQKQLSACMNQQELERRESIRETEEKSAIEKKRMSIEKEDYESLEQRKAPLRLYLQRNVVPLLSKGLMEVCRARPEDPVDFLAEWLIRNNPLDDSCFDL